MLDVSRRFTLWLSGYYEDFQTMRVISEGEDYASTDFFTNRRDSHAGNTMAAQAFNNPRFTYDYLTRSFAKMAPIPMIGSGATSAAASLHNEGPSQWLTYDENRVAPAFYEGRASLTYPDTIGDAASLRTISLIRRADFSRFASGWGTQNEYWVRQGATDSTYERSGFINNATHGYPFGTNATRGYGKFDIASLQPADTSGVPQKTPGTVSQVHAENYRRYKIMHSSSLCGVYLGETGETAVISSGIALPYTYLHPIKSPSGKPFYRHTMSRRIADYLPCIVKANGLTNKYDFADSSIVNNNFPNQGALGADDQWFCLNKTTQTIVATGQTYGAGSVIVTIPASLSPPLNRILDPANNRHLPNKNGATPTQALQVGTAVVEYDALMYNSPSVGDVSFVISTPGGLPGVQIQPSIIFNKWVDQVAGDTTLNVYNLTVAGVPNPESVVFQATNGSIAHKLGRPLLCFRDNSNAVTTTTARTANESFTVLTHTFYGYTHYSVNLSVQNPDGFSADPDNNLANDPFFDLGDYSGRLNVGDYITRKSQAQPEKLTVNNGDGSFMTDGLWQGVVASTYVRQATYGSYQENQGRLLDGMFGFQPVIVGDTELNASTDGERFTIRLANQSFNHTASAVPGEVDASYMLSVGYCQTQTGFDLNERGNMAGSKAAITHLFRPVTGENMASPRQTMFKMFEEGTTGKTSYTLDQLWYDLDVVIDFTGQQYQVYQDGAAATLATPFNAKYDGTPWVAADFYGWSLGVQLQTGFDLNDTIAWENIVTMIDRAGYIYALDGRIDTAGAIPTSPSEDFIVDKFKFVSSVDSIAQLEVNVIDDTDALNLPQLYSGRPNWKVLLFRDNDYRPIHSSIISNVNWKQSATKRTKELVMKGRDAIGELDFQFPYFDVGQKEGAPSLVAAYRRYEVTNYANIFHFGATSLLNLNMILGLDEDSKGSTGEYLPRYDQRTRLFSGHPIQMYLNEEIEGPNYVEDSWEASRLIDYFIPDPNDASKTRAVFKADAIKWTENQIPAGIKVAIKGNWRNIGVATSPTTTKSLPQFAEEGYLSSGTGSFGQEWTPHNVYRGEWTTEQAQSVTVGVQLTSYNFLTLADTSLFPPSGTVKVGGTGNGYFGSTTYTYTSKTLTTLQLTSTLGQQWGPGTQVRETTKTDYIILDQQWQRSLVITNLSDNGAGKLQITSVIDPFYSGLKYELMGGTAYAIGDSALAKNDLMTPTLAPNDDQFRIYFQPNAAGIAHNANVADLPSQVYETTAVTLNGSGLATYTTTTDVSSLSAGLQGALPIAFGAGAGGLADGIECDLAYMTYPKLRGKSFTQRNVGSSYAHRDTHARWIRDIPQSLWFQKTFGIIDKYPYGATAWSGAGFQTAAMRSLASNFESGVDTTINIGDTSNFPFSGVCEIWTNTPNPRFSNHKKAIMLTSFAYSGKTAVLLNNVMFADANKGVIPTSGAAGDTTIVCRKIKGDYKHCFILWADMRNDGSADADGGTRKEDFGLIHPIQQNYKISVVWAETGQDFVDLKLGQDCDIWSLSAENDPAATAIAGSSKPWSDDPSAIMLDYSSPPTIIGKRSNTTELSDYYKNWQDTAGAFIVVDLSKFFNVNTEANNGRINQTSGGNKPLGEYLVENAGTPTLIDSYWYHAAATFQNSAQPILQHQNTYRWVNAETVLSNDIVTSTPLTTTTAPCGVGDTTIFVPQSIQNVHDPNYMPSQGATNCLLGGVDTFDYTGKAGKITALSIRNRGSVCLTGNGTWTTTGGGGTGANGTFDTQHGINVGTLSVSSPGTFRENANLHWESDDGWITGRITTDSDGDLELGGLTVTSNTAKYSQAHGVPTFKIRYTDQFDDDGAFTGDNGNFTGATMQAAGQLANIQIVSGGTGYTSSPTFVLSTANTAQNQPGINATVDLTELTGVTNISQSHPAGTGISLASTFNTLHVEDTTDFPTRMGVTAFAGESTAALIEAKTTDADGNESTTQYVFTYTGKTPTSFTGVKYREVQQTETLDVAAGGLWANDGFTISGVPSMVAEGTKIRGSLGSSFPMGFMLKVEGKVKSPSGGNYYEHDKIRVYQSSALYSDWFKQITLPALSDINNVPIMEDYNVSANTAGAGTVESFGSVSDAQNKSILQTLRTMAQQAGVGSRGSLMTLNFQIGRDNRMEFRPTYNSGLSLTRDNLKVSNLKTSKAASFSHIRVLFNGGESSLTFPALEYKTNVRFKYVNAVDVASYEQALVIAKQEYQKRKDPAFRVEAEVIRESNETQREGPMLANARYGYIADPAVQLMGRNGGYWTAGRGGLHFTGQNHALHGNILGYDLLDGTEYMHSSVIGIGIGGYNGADDYTTSYGTGQAKYPTINLYNMFPWTQMYYWYGAKSVSYAVQIVHIPKGMPKVSETTGEELRIFISDAIASLPATNRLDNLTETKKFNIHVADYDFDEAQLLNHVPKLRATQQGIETITTLGSGFFEVAIPASYWSAGNTAGYKMVVSVNAEYLNALARHKTADKFGGNSIATQTNVIAAGGQTLPTFTNVNEFSIFPLGIREYPELGSSAIERSAYYAPRIHITDDINFIPGTYAQYTDPYIDIDEILYITKVEYEYTSKALDTTKIHLERDAGRIPEGIEAYLATNPFDGTGATGGGVGGGGAGGGGGTGGREGTPTGPTGPFIPPTTDAFPFGYTHGQMGVTSTQPPLVGGTDSDLGGVQTPVLGGTNYQRLNTDTGVQQAGQSGDLSTKETTANQLGDQVMNRISNKMSMDSMLPNGIQGIPGQPMPSKLPPKVRAVEGLDTKFVSARGKAAVTGGGWVLPGASQLSDGEAPTNPVHTLELSATTPMDAAHPMIGLNAVVSCEVLVDSVFSLTTTITCDDTGETVSHTYTEDMKVANNGISRKKIPLIPQQYFDAAQYEGRSLSVVITRSPNQGADTAVYSSVVVHGIELKNVVHNNQGTPESDSLSAFAGNTANTTPIDEYPFDLQSDTNPL